SAVTSKRLSVERLMRDPVDDRPPRKVSGKPQMNLASFSPSVNDRPQYPPALGTDNWRRTYLPDHGSGQDRLETCSSVPGSRFNKPQSTQTEIHMGHGTRFATAHNPLKPTPLRGAA